MKLEKLTTNWLQSHLALTNSEVRVELPDKQAVLSARGIVSAYNARALKDSDQPIYFIANGCDVLLIRTPLPVEEIKKREKLNK